MVIYHWAAVFFLILACCIPEFFAQGSELSLNQPEDLFQLRNSTYSLLLEWLGGKCLMQPLFLRCFPFGAPSEPTEQIKQWHEQVSPKSTPLLSFQFRVWAVWCERNVNNL